MYSSTVYLFKHTYIPERRPPNKIWVIDLPLRVDVLARAHNHGLGRSYVDQGC